MTDIVTGTPAVVGFTSGSNHEHGWSAKDTTFSASLAGGERTRDVLTAQWATTEKLRDVMDGVSISVERNGRSAELATEKTGAAGMLSAEKTASASILFAAQNAAATALASAVTTAAIQAAIAACCCETKELVRAENGQTRDLINNLQDLNLAVQLADQKAEIIALRLRVPTAVL
jgi:hypothetical protein